VDNFFFCQILESVIDIADNRGGLVFFKKVFFLQFAFQIAFITDLSDDVAISITCEYLIAFEDVGVIELLEYIDLGEQKFFQFLGFKRV
jgi:hypothetical protein